jgi:periplasmic divalent cation tolerance protein
VDEIADVTVTADNVEWLAEFTRQVVGDRLAACGNIVPAIRSIYRWQGTIEDDGEALVTFHTRRSLVPELVDRIRRDHPYDTPQVLALPVIEANPAYQQWVLRETREPTSISPDDSGDAEHAASHHERQGRA